MGQAKIRRDAAERGEPTQYTDLMDGSSKWGRAAPPIREIWNQSFDLISAELRGERPQAKVPCNGCTACCHMETINFWIAEERPDDLVHLDYEIDPENPDQALMRHKDDACIHLGPKGCTVYEHRPRCCRTFDCRFFAVTGVREQYEGGHEWPMWVSLENSEADRRDRAAMNAAQMIEVGKATKAGESWTANEMAMRIWQRTRELLPVMEQGEKILKGMSPEERERLATEAAPRLREEAKRLLADSPNFSPRAKPAGHTP